MANCHNTGFLPSLVVLNTIEPHSLEPAEIVKSSYHELLLIIIVIY